MLNWLFQLMDVVPAVRAATGWAKVLRGPEARIALLGILFVDAGLGWATWYFDIETTLQYSRSISDGILRTLSDGALVYAPIILIVVTVFPTAIRQTLSGLTEQLRVLAWFIIALNLFDARTDWPRVRAVFDAPAAWDFFAFAKIGESEVVQYAIWFVFRGFLWFMATDGFEVLLVAMIAATWILLVNSFRGRPAATGATVKLQP